MEIEFHKKISMEIEFVKLEFHKFKFLKSGRSLIISQTVVDPYIFCQTIVFDHFGPSASLCNTYVGTN